MFNRIVNFYKLYKLTRASIGSLADIPRMKCPDAIYKRYGADCFGQKITSSLDIGCGLSPRNPFNADNVFGVDIRGNVENQIKCADLATECIPFGDSEFDYITAIDFLEHIPRVLYLPSRRFPFVELMNEIYRTLKPGGIFFSSTPIYPFSPAFRDPTHVNIITNETFTLYFDDENKWGVIYGFNGEFRIVEQNRIGFHLISVLQKK
jgi:SAM-dependent methyltransferase